MRPFVLDIDVADASLTGFGSNVTGAAFVLTATAATDGLAHQVSIRNDSITDHSGKTVTLVGTDADGKAQTEVVTAPGTSATVESTLYFKTLTSATPSATIGADTFDIGWVDEVASITYALDWKSDLGATLAINVTGTIDYTVQETFDRVQTAGVDPQQEVAWFPISALTAKTTDLVAAATVGATAVRLLVNSYSSTAELQMNVNQSTAR